MNDSGVKVVEVRHGLRGVGKEGKGVLPLAEFDGDVGRHHTPVGGFPVGEDSRVPYLLAVYINPNPDDHWLQTDPLTSKYMGASPMASKVAFMFKGPACWTITCTAIYVSFFALGHWKT